MSRDLQVTTDQYNEVRQKILASGIIEALIEHVLGNRYMSYTQVRAGLGLAKKVLPDLASVMLANSPAGQRELVEKKLIEYQIVDPLPAE